MSRRELSWDDVSKFQIGDDGRLYWDDKAVLLEQRITLKGVELTLATIAALGALLAGVHPFGHSFGWW